MSASRTARDRARDELTRAIKDEARRQLALEGATKLSLRSVARELGMVSSALYRYFPSRDDLLTALIIDAYDALGEAAEKAAKGDDPRVQWLSACHAIRRWAKKRPHEYALIYGTPIPGYEAPRETVTAAARVPLLMINLIRDSWSVAAIEPAFPGPPLAEGLAAQLNELAKQVAPELPAEVLNRAIVAWTQLFGMISFELFGQLVGSVDPSDEFFAHTAAQMADFVGLVTPSRQAHLS
jgi:AcrR family transcriptional regulator